MKMKLLQITAHKVLWQQLRHNSRGSGYRGRAIAACCESPIYCNGRLLRTIQKSGLFPDSKTFVDMKMRKSAFDTVANFNELMVHYEDEPSAEVLLSFVRDHFESETELEDWFPPDFRPEPKFLNKISDPKIKKFAKEMVWLWPKLGRKLKYDVYRNPDRHSLIPLNHGIIVPSGTYRETYYWDTYWIVNGLLISEMFQTARGLINNFISMVKVYGFVPNAGRIYYAQRSQPPLLLPMAANYIRYTNDLPWLERNILFLKREIKYWRRQRFIPVEKYEQEYYLAHYAVDGHGPRPESYHEDIEIAEQYETEKDKEELYLNIKSAVQSGWNFSSRWIYDEKGDSRAGLAFTQAKYVIPVDLNSFLYLAYTSMAYLYERLGNYERKMYWTGLAETLKRNIKEMLWNEEDNMWYDYNVKLLEHRKKYYASNITPLWVGAYDKDEGAEMGKVCTDYLKRHGILDYKGGIPTSLEFSGLEWDFPNAWPPLQAIIVQGLHKSGHPEAIEMAKELATRWITANLSGFNETGHMFEKYNCVEVGKYGTGGEFTTQSGFGWTNSVILELILQYYCQK